MSGTTDEVGESGGPERSGPRREYDFEIADLDGATRDMLQLIDEHGEAHTSMLRKGTGLDRGRLKYRMDKLTDRGVVHEELKEPEEGGQEMRHLRFTEAGAEAVEAGLLEDILDVNTNVANLRVRVSDLERDVRKKAEDHMAKHYAEVRDDELRADLGARIEDVEADLAAAEEAVDEVRAGAKDRTATLAERLDSVEADTEERLAALEATEADDRLDDLEERADATDNEIAKVQREMKKLRRRIDDVEAGGRTRKEALGRLHERVAEEREEREAAVEEVAETATSAKSAATSGRRDVSKLRDEVEELREALERLDEERDRGGLLPWR